MAFFKFRKSGDDQPARVAQGESVEALRKRATFRLIGAAVLVLAGVIGFPLLFDSQPRPIPVDIAIEIPDKTKVKPLALPAAPATTPTPAPALVTTEPAAAVTPAAPVVAAPAPTTVEKKVSEAESSKQKLASSLEKQAQTTPKKEEIIDIKSANIKEKSKISDKEAARAMALLDGKTSDAAPDKSPAPVPASAPAAAAVAGGEGRFVVQVGAYSDAARVKETRAKLESAGLKTYAQVVETKDGPRTRVRVGPFADKSEADRVAKKVKSLDLPAAILAL